MTLTRGLALFVAFTLAAYIVDPIGSAESPAAPTAHLKSITSRPHAKGASLVIEVTEPAPYVTSRPDPLTVVLDFRGVGSQDLANSLSTAASGPIARVGVEATEPDGRPELARAHRPHAAGVPQRAQRAKYRHRRLRESVARWRGVRAPAGVARLAGRDGSHCARG